MNILLVILLYATWSSVFSIGKWTLQFTSPLFLTSTRMLFAGVLLLGYLFLFKREALKVNKKQFLSLLLLAIFSIYLANAFEFWGLKYLSAAKTCFIYSLSPFFAALFSYFHFGEKMTSRKWLGMLIGVIGIFPVLYLQTDQEGLMGGMGFISWPAFAIMGAALCSIYGWVLLRLSVKEQDVSPFMANGSSMILGGIFALIHSMMVESWQPFPIASAAPFAQGLLAMTFISNIICYNFYGMLLKRFTATFLSFMGLLSPIFASLNSWLLLGESPSWVIFLSTGIVSIGLWLVYHAELKQGYIKKREKPLLASDQG